MSPSLIFKADGFLPSALTSGFSLQYWQTKLPTSTETGPSLYFKQAGSSLLFSLTRPQGQHPQTKPRWPEQNGLQKSGRYSCGPRFGLRGSERKAEIFQNIIKKKNQMSIKRKLIQVVGSRPDREKKRKA